MARRKKSSQQSVSLFPFLSILACVIGTLTLMITALALGQMSGDSARDLEEFERANQRTKDERAKMEELQSKHDRQLAKLHSDIRKAEQEAGDTQKLLADKRAELQRMLDELEQAKNIPPEKPPLPGVDRETLDQYLAQLEERLQKVQEQIKNFEDDLKQRRMPPEEAHVQVRPGGSGVDLDPTFVECAASSIVVYDNAEPRRILRQNLNADEQFLALLDRIAESPKATVIFLVRDDGLSTYYAARNVARSRYARNGKLPVLGQGKIDLSMFVK